MTQIYVDRPHAVLLPIEHQLIRTTKRNEGCHLTSPTRSIWVSTPQEILSQLYFKRTIKKKERGKFDKLDFSKIRNSSLQRIMKRQAMEGPIFAHNLPDKGLEPCT